MGQRKKDLKAEMNRVPDWSPLSSCHKLSFNMNSVVAVHEDALSFINMNEGIRNRWYDIHGDFRIVQFIISLQSCFKREKLSSETYYFHPDAGL